MKLLDTLRQTGRTTRMLEAAKLHAEKHQEDVYVIVSDSDYISYSKNTNYTSKGLVFMRFSQSLDVLDLTTFKQRHPKIKVFVDHEVIEHQLAHALKLMHQFDKYVQIRF